MTRPEPHEHWNKVYTTKAATEVSWYQPSPQPSLDAIHRLHIQPTSSFIDVGGGASNLVDALLGMGWEDVTVLDIAQAAVDAAKARLGKAADKVHWQVADITDWHPLQKFDVWHDRAVFHFLTKPEQRRAYLRALSEGLADNGLVIMATFALDGPKQCSGLPVQRYDPTSLADEFGESWELIDDWRELHVTPWGTEQRFNWCVLRRRTE